MSKRERPSIVDENDLPDPSKTTPADITQRVRERNRADAEGSMPAPKEKTSEPSNTQTLKPSNLRTRKKVNPQISKSVNPRLLKAGYTDTRETVNEGSNVPVNEGGNEDLSKETKVPASTETQDEADDNAPQHKGSFDIPRHVFIPFKTHVAGLPRTSARRIIIRLIREYLKEQGIDA